MHLHQHVRHAVGKAVDPEDKMCIFQGAVRGAGAVYVTRKKGQNHAKIIKYKERTDQAPKKT